MDLIEKAIKTIKKYSMLQQGDIVLIGLSGGPDSVCLSVILEEVRDNFNLSLHALYLDHGLRPEESRDEEG
jgi:tRNA(Ile)-lysidine synthase